MIFVIMQIIKIFFSPKFLKFVVTGVLSTIINYGVFWILYENEVVSYLWASISGYIAGLILGYFLNKCWTFSDKGAHERRKIIGYLFVYITSLLVSIGSLHLMVEYAGLDPRIAQLGAIAISTVLNFLGLKFFVFKS